MVDPHLLRTSFESALGLAGAARTAFVEALRREDPGLAHELERLLDAHSHATTVDLRRRIGEPVIATVPTRIGPYRIVDLIGEGGMGTVWLAQQDAPLKRQLAIKVLRGGSIRSPDARARFDVERRALERMEHPGIARVLDAGCTTDGFAWLAMEFVDGLPITDYCVAHAVTLRARLGLFIEVCHAVEHAHRRGVLHRDIKPSNVLVAQRDGEAVVKVIDFGIAKAIDDGGENRASPTLDGAGILGTPGYMSPEQIAGDSAAVDTRSDGWALGVLAYELITDTLPFRGASTGPLGQHEQMHRVVHDDAAPPSALVPGRDVDRDLDAVVLHALEKDPDRRYPSAAALAADLERWLRGEPVEARVPGAVERWVRTWRRHRLAIGLSVSVVASLAIGLLVAVAAHGVARTRLEDFRRLADSRRVDELAQALDNELWPALPDHIPKLTAWLAEFDQLQSRLAAHRAVLAGVDGPNPDLTAAERAWMEQVVRGVVERLEAMALPGQARDDVLARLALAQRVARIDDENLLLWARAVDVIADPRLCPLYLGLRLLPHSGLVPLGRNPSTGLFEFWHVLSGDRPQWLDGEMTPRAADGIVLVLVPGGRVAMGCARLPAGQPAAAMCDPRAGDVEEPVHAVQLDPSFIARYEVTQAQWERATHSNPSRFKDGVALPRGRAGATNPVEQVDWIESRSMLRRLGLDLPTEAQWEHACRAGSRGSFWCGSESARLLAIGTNVADEGSRANYPKGWGYETGYDDGHSCHAPVGSFAANPYGLFDMHGNVMEWCRDLFLPYTVEPRAGDGLRERVAADEHARVVRGGCFNFPTDRARSSARDKAPVAHKIGYIGLRAALSLH